MVIKFICPNGHQLSAPDDRAGKTGKCPKCETAFVVPGLDEFGEEGTAGEAADSGNSGEPAAPSAAPAADSKGDVIVFLCPNGHKLNGPASLKGRPGKCPHCGAKFVIPGDEDEEEPPESVDASQPYSAETAAGGAAPAAPPAGSSPATSPGIAAPPPPPPPPGTGSPAGIPFSTERSAGGTALDENFELVDEGQLMEEVPIVEVIEDVLLEGGHPLAAIVARFCDTDADSWQLNIGLKDGTSFPATRFSRQLSLGHYAVFAQTTEAHESDENRREVVTIVSWEAIGRIDVRRKPVDSDPLFQ